MNGAQLYAVFDKIPILKDKFLGILTSDCHKIFRFWGVIILSMTISCEIARLAKGQIW